MRRLFHRSRTGRTPPGDITCRELVELVSDYFEGALSDADRRRFESHVEMCEACTAYLGQMRETLRVVGSLEPEAISPEAEAELLAAFRGWKAGGEAPPAS